MSYAATPAMLDQAVADQTHLRVGIFDGGKALKEQRAHSMPELPLPPRSLEEVLRRPEAAAAAVLEMSPELRSTAARMVAGRSTSIREAHRARTGPPPRPRRRRVAAAVA